MTIGRQNRILRFMCICSVVAGTYFDAQSSHADSDTRWTWVDSTGKVRTRSDLDKILKRHQLWQHGEGGKGGKGSRGILDDAKLEGVNFRNLSLQQFSMTRTYLTNADLSNSDLTSANLTGADLSESDLTHSVLNSAQMDRVSLHKAVLSDADCSGASMQNVDFTQAEAGKVNLANTRLDYANFSGMDMRNFNLTEAALSSANLKQTNFKQAFLDRTSLHGADLTGAYFNQAKLLDVDLEKAELEGTDLYGTVFQPQPERLPKARSIAKAKNLEYLTYEDDSEALARLRQNFREAGFRDQERKITYALKSRQAELLWESCSVNAGNCFEYWVNRILFDLPSQYGMNPGRVLITIVCIFGVSTILYWMLIHSTDSGLSIIVPVDVNQRNHPLWLVADLHKEGEHLSRDTGMTTKIGYRIQPRDLQQLIGRNFYRVLIYREVALFRLSLFFSLMSTFNIKFKDVDFGRWLRQLTTKEYDIRAAGMARTLSGIQALLSVYFIALLLVTYFGRPFE